MACCIVVLDKFQGVRRLPVGIGETLRRSIAKLAMKALGDQAKTACRSLQLCEGLEACIEGVTNAKVQIRQERTVLVPEGGKDKESEDGISTAAEDAERVGGAATMGGVGEVPLPPGGGQATEEGKVKESNELRIVM